MKDEPPLLQRLMTHNWIVSFRRKISSLSISKVDKNKDGKINADEIAKATDINKKNAQIIVKKYDYDGDGHLNRNEFNSMVKSAKIIHKSI